MLTVTDSQKCILQLFSLSSYCKQMKQLTKVLLLGSSLPGRFTTKCQFCRIQFALVFSHGLLPSGPGEALFCAVYGNISSLAIYFTAEGRLPTSLSIWLLLAVQALSSLANREVLPIPPWKLLGNRVHSPTGEKSYDPKDQLSVRNEMKKKQTKHVKHLEPGKDCVE